MTTPLGFRRVFIASAAVCSYGRANLETHTPVTGLATKIAQLPSLE